jgi:vacuolar protein sorting-associated protein VTA1
MSSSTPLDIPPELKKITTYIRRAEELDKGEKSPEKRIVSYYCRQYAVSVGLPFARSGSQAVKVCLSTVLNHLEKEKPAISTISRKEAESLIRQFANQAFSVADNEDRSGCASRSTARTFFSASCYFEILQQFITNEEELTEEQKDDAEKRVYGKWKATQILKAMKEGRNVIPGGYGELEGTREQLSQQNEAVSDFAAPVSLVQPSAYDTSTKETGISQGVDDLIDAGGKIEISPPLAGNPQNGIIAPKNPVVIDDNTTLPSKSLSSSLIDTMSSFCAGTKLSSDDSPPTAVSVLPSVSSSATTAYVPPTPSSNETSTHTSSKSKNTLVSSFAGAFGGGNKANKQISKDNILDAMELSIFAQRCIMDKDSQLAVTRLQAALLCLGSRYGRLLPCFFF